MQSVDGCSRRLHSRPFQQYLNIFPPSCRSPVPVRVIGSGRLLYLARSLSYLVPRHLCSCRELRAFAVLSAHAHLPIPSLYNKFVRHRESEFATHWEQVQSDCPSLPMDRRHMVMLSKPTRAGSLTAVIVYTAAVDVFLARPASVSISLQDRSKTWLILEDSRRKMTTWT